MKNLILLFLTSFLVLSCGDNALELRDDFNKSTLYGTWEDVSSLPDNFTGLDPSFKYSVFTFKEDGTYIVEKTTSPLDIFNNGKWEYDDNERIITFHEYNYIDSLLNVDVYDVTKTWKILDYKDQKISVNYRIFREKSYVYSLDSTEILDTISAIDVTMYRELEKQE